MCVDDLEGDVEGLRGAQQAIATTQAGKTPSGTHRRDVPDPRRPGTAAHEIVHQPFRAPVLHGEALRFHDCIEETRAAQGVAENVHVEQPGPRFGTSVRIQQPAQLHEGIGTQ